MKSGLEGRNNLKNYDPKISYPGYVSMKSGLEGRNNDPDEAQLTVKVKLSQ